MMVTVEAPETPVWIMGDATRLSQIVGNLLDNAIRFRDSGTDIEIRLQADEEHGQAVLTISDKGMGIEAQMLPVLFDVFAQADKSLHRTRGGLGLGLSLVKGLVGLHGGEVSASSAGPGRGAEFTVRLPLEHEPPALSAIPSDSQPSPQRLRILVVEDNKDSAASLQLLLTLLGHEVRLAYSGTEGLATAMAWLPNVIISDIGLPGLDGYEVATQLRSHPETAEARLIAITGYGSEADRRRALESGFDFHIAKPADPAVLQQLLACSPKPLPLV
jgi:CheY-like chemotaxis protein